MDLSERHKIIVIADNIRSLHNVGSIFRTSDACRIEKLYLCGITGCPPSSDLSKTALGAENTVPYEYFKSAHRLVKKLKKECWSIICLENTKDAVLYSKVDFVFPLCLIIGNEISGISASIRHLADQIIFIPMHGQKESLNVSVAFGIALYKILEKIPKKTF